jgi:tetratricopeptide (TPR) repeat protein
MPPLLIFLFLAVCAHGATATPAEQGAALYAKGDGEGAVAAFEKAVALDPASSELHRQLGDAYGLAAQKAGMFSRMSLGKKSIAAYEKAVALDPANLAARGSLATVYQMAPAVMGGGMDKAYAQAAEIKKRDDNRGRLTYALLHIGEKKYAEARAEVDEVLRAEPGNYAALFQTGRLAALAGDQLDRGLAALQQCLALPPPSGAPGHDAAHWRLGNIHEKKGDKAAARAAYQASLKMNPNFQQAKDSLAKLDGQ